MVRILKSKKFLVGLAILFLLAGGIAAYVLFMKVDTVDDYIVLESEKIKSELAKGECSNETKTALQSASNSSDDIEKAKLYENQGLCFVYAGDFPNALKAYKLSQEAYNKAGLADDAARLGRAIEGVTAASMPRTDVPSTEDVEVIGGT